MAKTVRVDADQFVEKHNRRTKAALQDMRAGVERVTEAPGKKAAAAQGKMRAKVLESIDNGKWARRVGSVTLEDWKADMLQKGVDRVPAGLDRAEGKVRAFAEKLIPAQNRALAEMEGMPNLTLEDGIARAVFWIRKMAELEV